MSFLRNISPAVLDTTVFSCKILNVPGLRSIHTACRCESIPNRDIKINPLFLNRNPRALEHKGIAPKIKGWKFQSPRKDFYHKLVYDKSRMYACVVHGSGKLVLEASSTEPALLRYLYSTKDVSASYNLGILLARRMLEAGITDVFYDHDLDTDLNSEKKSAFFKALEENAIKLSEPDVVKFESEPGIDYEGYSRLGEKPVYRHDYQKLTRDE
ncbi:39S ribosomal protein L18, mitochondrial-like [Mya arenaria]|uniref:39S ribosomal protein L18, mitochondrial-like n=1 Tax=Mya arenaria TaxID=6604 RepID=UPI0022E965CD|nr:39S ribosomal protein L18, mitochondrial-like [Mya arenaria]